MCFCCENCFTNIHIKEYIKEQNILGQCDYCHAKNSFVINIVDIGAFFRESFNKAYEPLDAGTGSYYDPEEKEYCGQGGEPAQRYSVMDILEDECVFDEVMTNKKLVEDIMTASGPSFRDIKHGEIDPYGDIYNECYVLKDDLEGVYGTQIYYTWDHFKFIVKHYNRFFDVDGYLNNVDYRKKLLDAIQPLIMEYDHIIPVDELFYRARRISSIDFDTFVINKELSPAPPQNAQTNRMSPAGISYLYVSSTKETACEECRYIDEDVIIAEYRNKKELQIIDFSKTPYILSTSIFSEDYDHDTRWLNQFLNLFVEEISRPVDSNNTKIDRSYEYVATQLIAEYIRSLGYDGIGFKSSVGEGVSYCFFCGPDLKYSKSDYGIFDEYICQMLPSFLESFNISSVSLFHVNKSKKLQDLHRVRNNEEVN